MKKTLITLCLIALGLTAAAAQEKKENSAGNFQPEVKRGEMRKLAKLLGKWSGEGWMQMGASREEFTGTENVQLKLDGLATLIEGRFTAKKEPEKVIHETLAVLSYNPKTNIYDFKNYLANGSGGDFTLSVTESGYEWGMNFPGTKILYTIIIKNGVWNEIGKMSRDDGKTWFQFFEMNLKKL